LYNTEVWIKTRRLKLPQFVSQPIEFDFYAERH